jgi:hypothetical protein
VVFQPVDPAEFAFQFVAADQDEADANFYVLQPFHYLRAFVVLGVDVADVDEDELDLSIDLIVFEVFGGKFVEF